MPCGSWFNPPFSMVKCRANPLPGVRKMLRVMRPGTEGRRNLRNRRGPRTEQGMPVNRDLKNKHDVHHQPFYGVGYGDRTEFKLSIFPNVHVHINMHNCMYIVLKYIMNNNCVSVHIYIMIYTYIHTHISIQPPLTSIHPHSKNGTRIHVLRSSQVDFRLPWLIMVD